MDKNLTIGGVVMAGALMLWLYFNKSVIDRGVRNNNPMNIKRNNIQWDGAANVQTDDTFVQFETPVYGIRAGAKILLNYQSKYDLYSIRTIINRWAPPSDDNPTDEYVAYVARKTGVDADMYVDVRDIMNSLIVAMVEFENGENPYKATVIREGISLATS